MAQSEVIKILKQYCLLLIASGIKVDKAYLYGSYLHGDATPDSDIDVMIVSSLFDKENIEMKSKAWRLTEKISFKIEPYIVGTEKFLHDDVSPLLQIVKKEGFEIKFV